MSDARSWSTSDALHQRVQRFMHAALAGEAHEPFDTLACDLARFQAAHVAPVARLFAARGVSAPERAADIPAVVSDAFRLRRIAAHAAEQDERCFVTSGTTAGTDARGRHPMRRTDTYALGALGWGKAMLCPSSSPLAFVGLVATESAAPDSSLTFMLTRFAEHLATLRQAWLYADGRLDVDGVVHACRRAAEQGEPVLLCGTSFAFVHLEDVLADRRLPLPRGSRVMQTGGFKGKSREVDSGELRALIARRFDLAITQVVGEYGMTELSSQLYQGGLTKGDASERYWAPPWLRVRAVDPISLVELPPGEAGLARFVDLANVDSAVAIQTADRIVVDDQGGVELLGRQPGATPRGCSLALEHLLS